MTNTSITTTTNTTTTNTNDARISSASLFAAIDHAVKSAKNPMNTQAGRFVVNAVYFAAVRCIDAMSVKGNVSDARATLDATLIALARLQGRVEPVNADRLLFRLTRDSGDMLKVMGIGGFKSWLKVYTDNCALDYTLPAPVKEPSLPAPKTPRVPTVKEGDSVRPMTADEIKAHNDKKRAKLLAELAKLDDAANA